jgi:hypothetical protein
VAVNENADAIAKALHDAKAPTLHLEDQNRLRRMREFLQDTILRLSQRGEDKTVLRPLLEYLEAVDFVLTVETLRAGLRAQNPE